MAPYESVYRAPKRFLTRKGLVVYCTYKDDDVDNGPHTFWFTLDPEVGDEAGIEDGQVEPRFDARELPTWAEPAHPPFLSPPGGSKEDYEAYRAKHDTPENRAAWEKYHADRVEEKAVRAAIRAAIDSGALATGRPIPRFTTPQTIGIIPPT